MTDALIVVIVAAFAALGYFSGLVRRVLGLAGLFAGFAVASTMTPFASNLVIQSNPTWSLPDTRMVVYPTLLVLVFLVVEAFAAAYQGKLQISFVVFDHASGAVFGALVALLGVTVVLHLLLAAAAPKETAPDGAQIQVATAIQSNSSLAPVLLNSVGGFAVILFRPVTPPDPSAYFNGIDSKVQ